MLRYYWEKIPRPIRTIINVSVAGALVFFFGQVLAAGGVASLDWATVGKQTLDAFGVGVATAGGAGSGTGVFATAGGDMPGVTADEIPGDH